ncbi:MAG: Rrf2 family transcriptional regulator [Desulfobacteraceae bacterium]|nr:Rrf2 family transcriptional regulator [Desulfobacteraceae bacterium]
MKLSTRSRYSVRILLELARNTGTQPVQVSEISRRQKIPPKYVEQLIRTLKSSRLILSSRGPKGGYTLAKPAKEISLGDIVRIFEGQADLVECVDSPDKCDMAGTCPVRAAWTQANAALFEKLDAISINDLVCTSPNAVVV